MPDPSQRSFRDLLHFYLPLVATSQMMTLSNPLLNLHLSRADDPTLPLAGYSVAFGVCILLYAPLLSLPNIGAALIDGDGARRRLTALTLCAGALVSGIDLLLALSPLGDWVYGQLLHSTDRVTTAARQATLALAPIPLLVGWRGLRSALVLRSRRTGLLTQATAMRLTFILAVLLAARVLGSFRASTAALALSCGILAETVWLHVQTRRHVQALDPALATPSWSRVARFSLPLVSSAYAWSALRPLINGILGRTAESEAAQASFGVLHPILLLTGSALWALQATGQLHADSPENARRFLRFCAVAIAIACSIVFALGWLPPLRNWLLGSVFPLPSHLLDYVRPAMKMLFVAPLFLGLRSAFKGIILASGGTGIIFFSALCYLTVAAAVGSLSVSLHPNLNGAVLGIALVTLVEAVEAAILGTAASRRVLLVHAGHDL